MAPGERPRPLVIAGKTFDPSHPQALAIYCSDGRFTDVVEELLHGLGHPRLDTLTLPGGPALFNTWLAGMSAHLAMTQSARFLIEAHATRSIVLIAHEGCGFYKKHYPTATVPQVRVHQEGDLRHARDELRFAHPHVDARMFVAALDGQKVRFDPIV